MKKQFLNALLCGAMVLSAGTTFVSCGDDTDELETRVAVLEGAYAELKAGLENALKIGASITDAVEKDGVWTLTLSNGQKIVIDTTKPNTGGGEGGGSSVTVTQGEGSFTITVDGTSYTIPTGAAINSLVYVPEYADGKVILGNDDAWVKFLATPGISQDALNNAEVSVVDAVELKTRLATETIVVTEKAMDGDYISVKLKGIEAQAGKTYAIAVKLNVSGTSITSNYFNVEMAEDFSFKTEELVEVSFNDAVTDAAAMEDGSYEATLPDGTGEVPNFLGEFNFADFFSIPATKADGVEYTLAPKDKQNSNVQNRYDFLKSCLSKDGTWKMQGRPGTNCDAPVNGEGVKEGQDGLLIYIKQNYQIKAKVYWKVIDPIAGNDFTGGRSGNFEAEWGGREKCLELGAQEINIPKILNDWETEIPIRHGGSDAWFALWPEYSVMTADEDIIIFNDGGKLTVGEFAKKYMSNSHGVYWFYRGLMICVPENMATTDGKYVDADGSQYSGGEGYKFDSWLGQYMFNDDFYSGGIMQFGITMDSATGIVSMPDTYTGWGFRFAIGCRFEYDYGNIELYGAGADQMGMLFFNRRLSPAGATMPTIQ